MNLAPGLDEADLTRPGHRPPAPQRVRDGRVARRSLALQRRRGAPDGQRATHGDPRAALEGIPRLPPVLLLCSCPPRYSSSSSGKL